MQISIARATRAMRYRLLNHTSLGVLLLAIFASSAKIDRQDRDEGRFVFVEGYSMLVCQLDER